MQTDDVTVSTQRRTEFVPVTRQILEVVRKNDWQDGVLTVFIPHTTAGVTINENADPDVARDMEWFSDNLVPRCPGFKHSEGNSDAHIKAAFYGSSVQVIIRGGAPWLGVWQGVYLCEFDGPRRRKIYLAFTG